MTTPQPARIFISAGERSGDVHASNLIRALRELRPELEFEGFGGPSMEAAGCRLHRNMLDLSVMAFSFLNHLGKFFSLIALSWRLLRERRPAALVLVDYPGFHFILARLARERGIPVIYYICPQIWGWAPWRRSKIIRLTDFLMVILPFEPELYQNPRTPVAYVGHPLADDLRACEAESKGAALRERLGVPPGGRLVGLFPGSRDQEVNSLMPLFRRILDGLGLDPSRHRVAASCCREDFRAAIESALAGSPAPASIEEGDARVLMAACDFALVASGTASLELAYYGKPMLVLYRVVPWQHLIYLMISVNPFISLVNILGRGEVVPERVVSRHGLGDLVERARDLFQDGRERDLCLRRLATMREESFHPGGIEAAARALARFLEDRGILERAPAGSTGERIAK